MYKISTENYCGEISKGQQFRFTVKNIYHDLKKAGKEKYAKKKIKYKNSIPFEKQQAAAIHDKKILI